MCIKEAQDIRDTGECRAQGGSGAACSIATEMLVQKKIRFSLSIIQLRKVQTSKHVSSRNITNFRVRPDPDRTWGNWYTDVSPGALP